MQDYFKTLKIDSLNHKGYGVTIEDGREYWSLNSLPGELVEVSLIKKKRRIRHGVAVNIIEPSIYRCEPRNKAFLSTSPWEIMTAEYENEIKLELIHSYYGDADGFKLPDFEMYSSPIRQEYRNKMEFSFYIDENDVISLAFFQRDTSKGKVSVTGSDLMPDAANQAVQLVVKAINELKMPFRSLKGLLVRYSFSTKKIVLALYVKDEDFMIPDEFVQILSGENKISGFHIIYSDRRSPAYVETKILLTHEDTELTENVGENVFTYGYDSFFQVNPPAFEVVIKDMKGWLAEVDTEDKKNLLDIYAGVGSIGLSLASEFKQVKGIELHTKSEHYAMLNAVNNSIGNYDFEVGYAEKVLNDNDLKPYDFIVVDPPRSGIDQKLAQRILDHGAKYIFYMSCNPRTQAVDLKQYTDKYEIIHFKAYNFYPCTPHVETLAMLRRKD